MKKKLEKLKFILMIMLILSIGIKISHAQSNITATLKAFPNSYSGLCPFTIKFTGEIAVRNITRPPLKVQYRFIRSDGALTPVETLIFYKPGSKKVTTTWTIGKSYSGWVAIKIIYPQNVESNKAYFKLVCEAEANMPDLIVSDIRFINSSRKVGNKIIKDCDIQTTIKNIGNAGLPDAAYGKSTGIGFQIWIDGELRGRLGLYAVDPSRILKNPHSSITFTWGPGAQRPIIGLGTHSVEVIIVDIGNVVKESNESNNSKMEKKLTCGTLKVLR